TVPFDNLDALEDIFSSDGENIAAFIIEPIQGEGGIIIPSQGYLKQAGELCGKYGVLLIVDEIQTGLGRTGCLFACEEEGVEPDILLLSKALGGGMVPIGACLCTKEVWNQKFGKLHSSTFANNNLTCSVGLAVLNKLAEENSAVVKNAAVKGTYIIEKLRLISQKYPGVIKDLRGRGLMVGVEFNDMDGSESFSMKYLCEQGGFTGLLAGFLLHNQQVRFAPFLNNPMTLRLQPSLIVGLGEVDTALSAIEYVTEILYHGDYNKLFSYLINRKHSAPVKDYRNLIKPVVGSKLKPGEKPSESFAFIIQYPSTEEMKKTNISFEEMTNQELKKILDWEAASDVDPQVLVHMPAIKSKAGKVAEGWLIGVPYSGKHLLELPRKDAVEQVGKAVDLAQELGAKMVGLGAYTSVVTKGGADLQGRGVSITSGNSYTIVTAYDALVEGARLMGIDTARATGSVIGATGSIGRVSALLLSDEVRQLLLVGNPQKGQASLRRLERLAEEIYSEAFSKVLARPDGVGLRGISKWMHGFINHLKVNPDKLKTSVKGSESGKNFYFTSFIKENLTKEDAYSRPPVITTLNINNAVAASDLIISASSSTSNLIGPEHLKPGSVICDVARPADVSKSVLENRKDVLVIEGGLV
ncbi:MAG TPA: aminotransferase class III-fold pyridoxal phosphate-dependent enzyme, partial [Desulfobacteria bacterium]|nr:aminotransferase class III-fold pyridoxal phosphate-dependent enzyme [Desulfobacteria bacterium]